jgi:hypothetical protein
MKALLHTSLFVIHANALMSSKWHMAAHTVHQLELPLRTTDRSSNFSMESSPPKPRQNRAKTRWAKNLFGPLLRARVIHLELPLRTTGWSTKNGKIAAKTVPKPCYQGATLPFDSRAHD